MAMYNSVTEMLGNTPILRISRYEKANNLFANLYAKIEAFNPCGSAKDRVALSIIKEALANGSLKEGGTIVEATSGNTGIALAAIGSVLGFNVIIVMPDTMSEERRKLVKAYGAELVLTPGDKGMLGAIEKAKELVNSLDNAIEAGQFVNKANPKAHFATTGPEIWQDMEQKVDIFVAGVGTGGTITGVGEYLKSKNPEIKIVAVEPAGSPVLSEGRSGKHNLQGIGANFVPQILNTKIYDNIITVENEDAYKEARSLGALEGVLVGISSGAALWAAKKIAQDPNNKGKRIVVLLPDTGERYLSTEMFE